MISISKKIKE